MTTWRKTAQRSAVILLLLLLSVVSGFLYQLLWDAIDRGRYPQEFASYVSQYSVAYGVPEYVVYAVIKTESDFVSNAVSPAGAIGLMQITPDTFEWISTLMKRTSDSGMLYDPATNIEYGTYLLSYLYMRYNRWDTAFAAYNAGVGRVDAWLADPNYTDEAGRLREIPYEETADYTEKVNQAIRVYRRLYYEDGWYEES